VRLNKRPVNKELELRVAQRYDLSVAFETLTLEGADHQEAVQSFLDTRPGVFRSGKFGGTSPSRPRTARRREGRPKEDGRGNRPTLLRPDASVYPGLTKFAGYVLAEQA
jgi:hypothetical protein